MNHCNNETHPKTGVSFSNYNQYSHPLLYTKLSNFQVLTLIHNGLLMLNVFAIIKDTFSLTLSFHFMQMKNKPFVLLALVLFPSLTSSRNYYSVHRVKSIHVSYTSILRAYEIHRFFSQAPKWQCLIVLTIRVQFSIIE